MGDAFGMLPGPGFPHVTSSLTLRVVDDLAHFYLLPSYHFREATWWILSCVVQVDNC